MDALDRQLLNLTQKDFPLCSRPFAQVAETLGLSEDEVIARFEQLTATGIVQRIGPVIAPHRIGVSTLAAVAVPPAQLEAMAERINAFEEINHNYEREHHYNLWFVITARNTERLNTIIENIQSWVDEPILNLPMEQAYHIDLGFGL